MNKAEEKRAELIALSADIAARRRMLVEEYKRTHALPSRGVIDTPELRALMQEEKQRYFAIIAKYKDPS